VTYDAGERDFRSEKHNLLQSCFAQVSGRADVLCEHFTFGTNRPIKHLRIELGVKLQNFFRLRVRCVVAAEFNLGSSEAKVVPTDTRMKSARPGVNWDDGL
jgi:hypothetical protein